MNVTGAIESQARVLWSLIARDSLRTHRTSPVGILSAIIEPLALILMMTLIFTSIRMRVPSMGDHMMLFLLTGVVPIYMFRRGISGGERAAAQMRGVLVFPTVRPLDLMFAGIINSFLALTALFIVILLFFKLFYRAVEPANFAMAMVPVIGNACIAFGFVAVNLVIKTWFRYWGTMFGVITSPIGILSGLFYTAEILPQRVLDVLYWNPIFHSTDLCRQWVFPEYNSTFFDPYYYYGWVFTSLVVGLAVERYFRYRLRASPR